jgi:ubiquitin-like modifier-activating enzyme 5
LRSLASQLFAIRLFGPFQAGRQRIEKMSAEVVDSNPYSRLMALQRMGIVKDYERIREKTVGLLPVS